MEILVLIIVIGLAVLFLKGFDLASGQSPKQVSDGIKQEGASEVQPDMAPAAVAVRAERIDQIVVLKLPFARPKEEDVCPISDQSIRPRVPPDMAPGTVVKIPPAERINPLAVLTPIYRGGRRADVARGR